MLYSGDMVFNLSGVDISKYYDINTAVSISLFLILVLPPLLLCVLCVLALVFAKEINSKIRLLLINIFAVEIMQMDILHLVLSGITDSSTLSG